MSLSSTSLRVSRRAGLALGAALMAGALLLAGAAAARAAPAAGGGTGMHDGMMPATSPDARVSGSPSGTAHRGVASAGLSSRATGIDLSAYQHPSGAAVDWPRVAASGQRFAIVKATELYTGTGGLPVLYTNPYLHADLSDAHAAGLVVGCYAFAHPEFSATVQADDFAAAVGTLPEGSLPPVLDLETSGGLSVAALQVWTQAFLDRLQQDTGVAPMIYTGPGFWSTYMGGTTAFARYPLWEAHWTSAPAPASFGGWSSYTVWQFTNTAVVPGISGYVDGNRVR